MIKIMNPEHFVDVFTFALNNHCLDKLMGKIEYLSVYNPDKATTVEIHPDWAPNSFAFVMLNPDGTRWFHGGLIYSGPGQPLDGSGPALTVGIGIDSSRHGWSVHT